MTELTLATDSNEVIQMVRPILQPIYEALETAVPNAALVISQQGWQTSPLLFSHLVRADVKAKLHGRQCPIEFDDIAREVVMDTVCNEGLSTNFENVTLKIFKGTVLPKATSSRRESFYQQTLPEMTPDIETAQLRSLVVLWDCDEEGNFLKIWLCCPKGKDGTYAWREDVPHPSEWMVVTDHPIVAAEAADDFDELLGNEDVANQQTAGE